VNSQFKPLYLMNNADDMIDTVTRSTMGLTVSCARCHDHKFDPIPTKDYYALAGIFASTEDDSGLKSMMTTFGHYDGTRLGHLTAVQPPPVPQERIDKVKAEFAAAKKANDDLKVITAKEDEDRKAGKVPPQLSDVEKTRRLLITQDFALARRDQQLLNDAQELGYAVDMVRDGIVADTTVRIRGEEERHGPVVPRGFLSLVNVPNPPTIPANHSGRLELAQWITNPGNPLTSRVYVNRVWQHLFGTGIVSSVDNFGTTGDQPSNPQLLDYLAQDFVQNGWSTKKLVREIVLTRAYRLGSDVPSGYRDIDPADRYVWRHAPRRLEAEEIRDTILAASGSLDLAHPVGSYVMNMREEEVHAGSIAEASLLQAADNSRYRSIYLPQLRDFTPHALAAFDPVSKMLMTGQRDETTVPSQALFMLNSPFVQAQSVVLADRLLAAEKLTDTDRIQLAYERSVGYAPTPADVARVKAFLSQYSATWMKTKHPIKPPTPSLYKAHLALVSTPAPPITQGIVREDRPTDDCEALVLPDVPAKPVVQAENGEEAAWAAFIQSLYGSAALRYVR
jgi:hypothetical protein